MAPLAQSMCAWAPDPLATVAPLAVAPRRGRASAASAPRMPRAERRPSMVTPCRRSAQLLQMARGLSTRTAGRPPPRPFGLVQEHLAQAHLLGGDLDALVLADVLQGLLERELEGRDQPDQLLGRRGPHVRS